ncbi:CBBY-like protein [Linum perenne]
MEAASATASSSSSPIRYTLNRTTTHSIFSPRDNFNFYLPPSFPFTSPRICNPARKCSRPLPSRFTAFSSSPYASIPPEQNPPPELAILLEVDGVLMDAYRSGNRQAFNVAFRKLGLDCANWTEPIYMDLLRKCTGDEERMLLLYFNRIGWPTSLPTSEKQTFMKNVLQEKKKALDEFAASEGSPLRPGVEEFIDDAFDEGIPVVIVTTYGKSDEKVARSIIGKLGQSRMPKIKIVGNQEIEESLYGQLVLGKGVSSGLDEQLAREVKKAASAEKQRVAEEVASLLNLEKVVAALRAGAETAGLPVQNCVLISGNQSGVSAANRIGMPCVVVRSSLTARAEFPLANGILDGFGGADLTVSRLRKKRWSGSQEI